MATPQSGWKPIVSTSTGSTGTSDANQDVLDSLDDRAHGGKSIWAMYGQKERAELASAVIAAENTETTANIEANAMRDTAAIEAEGAVQVAFLDYTARMTESADNLKAVEIQSETDLEIAGMERDVEMAKLDVDLERIHSVDSVNAQANVISANALTIEAEGEKARDEGRAAKDQAKAASALNSSYGSYLS